MREEAEAAEAGAKSQAQGARAMEHQAAAVADGAARQAAAAEHVAQAQGEALAKEADAKERLMEKQGQAAIASSVGRLSDDGVARIDTYDEEEAPPHG